MQNLKKKQLNKISNKIKFIYHYKTKIEKVKKKIHINFIHKKQQEQQNVIAEYMNECAVQMMRWKKVEWDENYKQIKMDKQWVRLLGDIDVVDYLKLYSRPTDWN